jgi:WD40 repeat protein
LEVRVGKIKVVLFAANPRGTAPLDLSREFREIDEEVGRGSYRSAIELILVPGTRPVDLLRKLNENQPQVVHFSSHGNPDEIILESGEHEAEDSGSFIPGTRSADERDMTKVRPEEIEVVGFGQGEPQVVSKSALVNVLRSCNEGNLRLVVLNACSTRRQAEALTEIVDFVVSMNRTITDRAAIMFAASFYGALAFGRSVQKAFEQGLARLSAEGIAEVDAPELLVRAGVDAADVVLVGSAPRMDSAPAPEAPFIVPFPRNVEFVGRDSDLTRLHAQLSGPGAGPVGIRPAGLTGMGGIGKTQLVVEYVYRHRDDYPDGVFWTDAAGPLDEGFARLATDHRLKWAEIDQPRDEQIQAAFKAMNSRPSALLVLDNLPEPAALAGSLSPGCTPEDLRCRLLFTTRRHDLGRFVGIEVTVLPEEPALQLLLRHPSRRAALDASHSDHDHARAIARMLGRLPLALELAGAYLGKFSGDVSLAAYRSGLKTDGALATLDADATELSEADLRRVHDPAVAATIGEQWHTLRDEPARLLLRAAGLFPESAAIPMVRLGLLAGLGEGARSGRLSPLHRAVRRLDDACLIERLEGDQVRLHPLIREFAAGQTLPEQAEEFRSQCAARAAAGLEDFAIFEASEIQRGVDGLQEDLISILELCPATPSDLGVRLQALLRLIQREAHNLRIEDHVSRPTLLAQQVRNRAFLLGIEPLRSTAEQRLNAQRRPHLRLHWTASRESSALIRTLAGHKDWVNAVAVTPNGRYALSGSHDCTLKLWDLTTGQPRLTFTGHAGPVCAVGILPDGCHALSGSADGSLRLWEITTGQTLRVFAEQNSSVYALAVMPDGRRAISGTGDGRLTLWDLSASQPLLGMTGAMGFISALAITPDGQQAISGCSDGNLKIWDLRTGQLLHTVVGHEDPVYALTITRDGSQVLSGSFDGEVKLWDLQHGRFLTAFPKHKDNAYQVATPVYALATTPDGRWILTGCGDGSVRLWELATAQLCGSLVGHGRGVTAVAVTPDGRCVLSSSTDETLKLWDLGTSQTSLTLAGHEKGVTTVAVTPDARLALSGSRDSTMRLWELGSRQPNPTLTQHDDWVTAVAVTPDGRHAISGCEDGILRVWNLGTGQLRSSLTGHKGGVTALAATPDGRHALSASRDGALKLWDLSTDQPLLSFAGDESFVSALAITPDGGQAITGFFDGSLKLWSLRTGELVRMICGPESRARATEIAFDEGTFLPDWSSRSHPCVSAVAITSDGRMAISGSRDGSGELRLWDLSSGELYVTLAGHADDVTAVVVTADGRYALSAADDRTVRLWNLEERVCRAIAPMENAPMAIAVAPDSRTVVVGDRVGNVHHFQVHLGEG